MSCPRAQGEGKITFPEPPSVVAAIARAKNRETARNKAFGGAFSESGAVDRALRPAASIWALGLRSFWKLKTLLLVPTHSVWLEASNGSARTAPAWKAVFFRRRPVPSSYA
jgi:hypothetical protein